MSDSIDIEKAKEIFSRGFANVLFKTAADCAVPFCWHSTKHDGNHEINNGTVFFLNTGDSCFAVTAYHVYKRFEDSLLSNEKTECQTSNLKINPKKRLIDFSSELDIMTFEVSKKEVNKIGKRFFEGHSVILCRRYCAL